MSSGWTNEETQSLIDNYPSKGMLWCCDFLDKTVSQIRSKASRLCLRQDRKSDFFIDWQKRAAASKVGKKRPDQSIVMKNLHKEGKLIRTEETNKLIGKKISEFVKINGHPKGFLGHTHTEESKSKISDATNNAWNSFSDECKLNRSKKISDSAVNSIQKRYKASWKCGWRDIGSRHYFFRSRWEANYARYLDYIKSFGEIHNWEHEVDVFSFPVDNEKVYNYLPDFKIINNDESIVYHEVKGWFDDRSKIIFKKMDIYYPDINLIVIDKKVYNNLCLLYGEIIPEWE